MPSRRNSISSSNLNTTPGHHLRRLDVCQLEGFRLLPPPLAMLQRLLLQCPPLSRMPTFHPITSE